MPELPPQIQKAIKYADDFMAKYPTLTQYGTIRSLLIFGMEKHFLRAALVDSGTRIIFRTVWQRCPVHRFPFGHDGLNS